VLAFLQIAAAAGSTEADTDAGIEDLKQGNYFAALTELLPPAKAGDARAQANLALIYHYGLGIAANFTKALQWYRAAALQGNIDGQIGLAVLYAQGQGVPTDLAIAHMWLNVVFDGLPPGPDRDRVGLDKETIATRLTPQQLQESERLVQSWYRNHQAP